MSGIGGKVRPENEGFSKKVGLFSSKVLCVNPSKEEYKDLLGMELKPESKADEYLGESKEGNTTLRINFWLEEVKSKQKFNVTFFLENKPKTNKEGTKEQYINSIGSCSWADDPNNLPKWFVAKGEDSFRPAYVGEEELYNFMRTWLGKLDFKDAETVLDLDWKKLMKGNVNLIKEQIDGAYSTNIVSLATVKTVVKDEESKEYQGVFNKAFLPEYCLKFFKLIDYNKSDEQSKLKVKKSSDLKPYERFVVTVSGEFGCKDFYRFSELKDYDSSENIVSTNQPKTSDGPDY